MDEEDYVPAGGDDDSFEKAWEMANQNDQEQNYGNEDVSDQDLMQWLKDSGVDLTQADGGSAPQPGEYSNEGRNYSGSGGLDASKDSPTNAGDHWYDGIVNFFKGGSSELPNATNQGKGGASGLGSILGTGKSGSTSFSLGSLLDGIKGSDVLGMVGAGVSGAMMERQMEKNREFQKELQDRQWAREDKLDSEKRKRQAPAQGLINAAITTIKGTS